MGLIHVELLTRFLRAKRLISSAKTIMKLFNLNLT
jgi:hypothetical protein